MREYIVRVAATDSAYALHQAVWSAVRTHSGDHGHFLFREVEGLVKVREDGTPATGERAVQAPVLGQGYAFRVLVNPRRHLATGQYVPISSAEEAEVALRRQLEAGGFTVHAISGGFLRGKLFDKRGYRTYRMRSFLAQGTLAVRDAERSLETLRMGVGASRRFGYGLLELQ